MSNNFGKGWAMRQVPFVMDLKAAQNAIAKATGGAA